VAVAAVVVVAVAVAVAAVVVVAVPVAVAEFGTRHFGSSPKAFGIGSESKQMVHSVQREPLKKALIEHGRFQHIDQG